MSGGHLALNSLLKAVVTLPYTLDNLTNMCKQHCSITDYILMSLIMYCSNLKAVL